MLWGLLGPEQAERVTNSALEAHVLSRAKELSGRAAPSPRARLQLIPAPGCLHNAALCNTDHPRQRRWAPVRWEVCGGAQNWIQVSQPLNYSSSPPQQPHHCPATHTIVCLCSSRVLTGLHAPENVHTGIWVLTNPLELSWLKVSVSLPIIPSTQQNGTQDTLLSAGDSEHLHFIHFVKSYKSHQPQKAASYEGYMTVFKMEWWLSMSWARKGVSFHLSLVTAFFNAHISGSKMHASHLGSHWRTHLYTWPAASCIKLSICKTSLLKTEVLLGHGKTQ